MHLLTAPGTMGVPAGTVVKNPPASAGDTRGAGSIPGSWRSPGGGSGNLPQYSYLENSRDRGVWRVTMGPQRVRHNWAHTHTHTHTHIGTVSCQISISGWPCLFIAWKVCTAFEMQAGYSFHYLLQKELCDNRTLTFFSKLFSHSTLPLFVLLKLEILHLPDEPRVYSATPRTIQSMKFSRQEYWSG